MVGAWAAAQGREIWQDLVWKQDGFDWNKRTNAKVWKGDGIWLIVKNFAGNGELLLWIYFLFGFVIE